MTSRVQHVHLLPSPSCCAAFVSSFQAVVVFVLLVLQARAHTLDKEEPTIITRVPSLRSHACTRPPRPLHPCLPESWHASIFFTDIDNPYVWNACYLIRQLLYWGVGVILRRRLLSSSLAASPELTCVSGRMKGRFVVRRGRGYRARS